MLFRSVVDKLSAALAEAVKNPAYVEKMKGFAIEAIYQGFARAPGPWRAASSPLAFSGQEGSPVAPGYQDEG